MIIKVFGWKVGLDRVNSISVRLVNDQRSRHLPNYLQFEGEDEVAQSCPTLCDPVDCSLPGFSIHGILQSRILEWVTISFSRGSSWPRGQTRVSHIGGRCFNLWAIREALVVTCNLQVTDKKIHIFLQEWCFGITPLTFHFEPFFSLRWLGKQDSHTHGHLSAKGDSSWKGREASRKKECGKEMRKKLVSMSG